MLLSAFEDKIDTLECDDKGSWVAAVQNLVDSLKDALAYEYLNLLWASLRG